MTQFFLGLPRTIRTVRYLRPSQVINRVARRVRPVRVDAVPAERLRLRDRSAQPPAFWPTNAYDGRSFRLLNEQRSFQGTDRVRHFPTTPHAAATQGLHRLRPDTG